MTTQSGDQSSELTEYAASSVAEPPRDSVRLDILKTIYQADRTDQGVTLTVALALVGTGLAYVTGTLAFADQIFKTQVFQQLPWVALLVPIPVWMIASYHSLIATSAMTRAASIMAIEKQLKIWAGFAGSTDAKVGNYDQDVTEHIGFTAGERILNLNIANKVHGFATIITYGFNALIIPAYTAYFIFGAQHLPWWQQLIGLVAYSVLLIAIGASWISGVRRSKVADKVLNAARRAPSTVTPT
jgi:hypothetical protein